MPGRAGEVRFVTFDGATIIELDSNGDRLTDFQIELGDAVALTFADFLGVETDASGRAKKTVSTTVATSNEPGASSGQYAEPSMTANDTWLPSTDGLLIYA